ncbi:DUF1996 domain-containing protein [Streptomyces sp. H27-D2]|uniref:DUF1996 domain-containing protein n=1 Tax=Streptomyces sp. H27-D2 TaxID=3046304 RepID=UPI002DB84700|nr:DUF1996 domain-containing protein [Streptomyces sp. H27-D2]MEC4019961.1 DUF1996 domain-containing protein [Streptomyces sp. H27-D2]
MPHPHSSRHRRRLSAKHLVLIAVLALLGSAGTFAVVTGAASANPGTSATGTRSPGSPADPDSPVDSTAPGNPPAPTVSSGPSDPDNSTTPSQPPSSTPSSPSVTPPTDNPPPSTAPSNRDNAPAREDYVDIRDVRPSVRRPTPRRDASRGTFTSECGRNENGHRNPDNFIVTPGVSNGAHHLHDYVGNRSTDAFSTDSSLRAAGTTCGKGDRSAYFWPVLRVRDAEARKAPDPDGNNGRVLTPRSVSLTFRGSPAGKVTAMPKALRVITGDAKAFTNGPAKARAQWTCTGFTDRVLTDKYPLCPSGSRLVRLLDFPSCWDGAQTDSADHRGHIVFPDRASGRCANGFKAVPQLRMKLTYAVPTGPSFTLDSFPEQLHKPVTDHADFANFMGRNLMRETVRCVNSGRDCG